MRFHPFQGRPLFGLKDGQMVAQAATWLFPSLSGKTSFRTSQGLRLRKTYSHGVSIPFREDLHSDSWVPAEMLLTTSPAFPSLSGKTFIRTINFVIDPHGRTYPVSIPFREDLHSDHSFRPPKLRFIHTTRVSIPFREDLHSDLFSSYSNVSPREQCFHPFQGRPSFGLGSRDLRARILSACFHPFQGRPSFGPDANIQTTPIHPECFHPFQGRPSFGHLQNIIRQAIVERLFPSLSGKTFIRTFVKRCFGVSGRLRFPSLSGKTFIRTNAGPARVAQGTHSVSIPFREDLHSDFVFFAGSCTSPCKFPSLSGKTFIRTRYRVANPAAKGEQVSIPFREDLHSDSRRRV